jgi:hypothetical protein
VNDQQPSAEKDATYWVQCYRVGVWRLGWYDHSQRPSVEDAESVAQSLDHVTCYGHRVISRRVTEEQLGLWAKEGTFTGKALTRDLPPEGNE